MLRFLVATMMLLVGWLQPAPLPTEAISLDNADRIEELQIINYDPFEENILEGLTRDKWAVAFSPDSTTLVFGGRDEFFHIWDIASNTRITSVRVGYGRIEDLVFSPDGATLFVLSGRLRRWSTLDWTEQPLTELGYTWEIAISPDGSILAIASQDRVELYDSATLAEIRTMTHEGIDDIPAVNGIAFSSDGENIASIRGELLATDAYPENSMLSVWDVNTGELLGETAGVWTFWSVAYSPDGTLLAASHRFGDIGIWDAQTLASVATLPGRPGCENIELSCANIHTLVFSLDSTLLISGDEEGSIRVWDMVTFDEIRTLEGHTEGITDLALSDDGTMLASASLDGTVRLWGVR